MEYDDHDGMQCIWTCLTLFDRVGEILFYQVVNIIQEYVPQAHVIYRILFYS
jgi:hypothetical protein